MQGVSNVAKAARERKNYREAWVGVGRRNGLRPEFDAIVGGNELSESRLQCRLCCTPERQDDATRTHRDEVYKGRGSDKIAALWNSSV